MALCSAETKLETALAKTLLEHKSRGETPPVAVRCELLRSRLGEFKQAAPVAAGGKPGGWAVDVHPCFPFGSSDDVR